MKKITLYKSLTIILILNFLLAAVKLSFGLLGNSISLTNDGINSAIDFVLSIMLVITINFSNKKSDKNHPYGHEKFEGIFSLIISFLIVITGVFLVIDTITRMINFADYLEPKTYTLISAIISVVVKIFLFKFTKSLSQKFSQPGLKADSVNHFADALATSVVVIGILLSLLGYKEFDYIASLIIAIIIAYSGVKLFIEATSWLVDQAPNKDCLKAIKEYILSCEGVIKVDDMKVRMHVTKLYVDVEISVDRNLSLIAAHEIAEKVHLGVEEEFEEVIHCMVYVNPAKK